MTKIGKCACGCGQKTPIASKTSISRGWVKGQPIRCVLGHNSCRLARSAPDGFRRCPKCSRNKPLSEFHKCSTGSAERNSYCMTCNHTQHTEWRRKNPNRHKRIALKSRLKKFGISLDDYDRIMELQGGVCAACKQDKGRRLCVDHDHATGRVRGILCTVCNLVLGLVADDPKLLASLASYIRQETR